MTKCSGCGAILQTEIENVAGYIPKEKEGTTTTCARCFKITNYNQADILSVPVNNEEIIKIVNETNSHSIFMIDFLNINSETINTFHKIKGNKTLIISKSDIIPKSIKKGKISEWLLDNYNIKSDIIYLSTKKNVNTNFIEKIAKNNKKIHLLGYTNAGKSTYINKLLTNYMDTNLKMTTSMIPNTTLDFITIELTTDLTIIDSPGFQYPNTIYEKSEIGLIKRIDPKKFLSPITYQVKDITYINIENRILLKSDIENSFTCYMSNQLDLSKIYNSANYEDLKQKTFEIYNNTDIVIKGIGFINIKKSCNLTIHSDYLDLIEIRESLFD